MALNKVLLIGSGGREHALAWKLAQSPRVEQVVVAPGNAGTQDGDRVVNIDLDVKNHTAVLEYCRKNGIALVVVGPEDPLADGLSSHLNAAGVKCFGPCKEGAQIEASKAFAKAFMDRHRIPTARWETFTDADQAKKHIMSAPYDALVVKASGLAAGKGVIVAKTREEAVEAIDTLKQEVSSACDEIVIEELLTGEEVSVLCFSDGTRIGIMPSAQDHKRLLDRDEGPNTGGMGAYCPCPLLSSDDLEFVREKVMQRAIDGMRKDGTPYVGVLYAGLMLTPDGPKVLEYNCRFGDPETQVILPLLESDMYSIMLSCVEGKLDPTKIRWSASNAVGVVMVSGGYPKKYPKGKPISGLEQFKEENLRVFHAGTALNKGTVVTSGGRVLAVVALGESLEGAANSALCAAQRISFEGAFFRRDIAHKAFKKKQRQEGLTYKSSGVDIELADDLIGKIKSLVKQTMRQEVCGGIGGFGGIFDLSGFQDPLLVCKAGSIGGKLELAQQFSRWETVGHDLVSAVANEVVATGAETLFFLDTFSCGKLDVGVAHRVVSGIANACKTAGCTLIGGETAEMPGMYPDGVFDLTGFARGAVERTRLLPSASIGDGDVAIGILSDTINFDGFRIVNRLLAKYSHGPKINPDFQPLVEELLAPTQIYAQTVLSLLSKVSVKGIAYINKGGLVGSVGRILPRKHRLVLDASRWEESEVFKFIRSSAEMSQEEMSEVFNCGIDMVLVVDKNVAAEALKELKGLQLRAAIVGTVISSEDGGDKPVTFMKHSETPSRETKRKVAILTSTEGTVLSPLICYIHNRDNLCDSEIALVITNADGANLKDVKQHKIPILILGSDMELSEVLSTYDIDLICLDKFRGKLNLGDRWKNRILSSHPSLLPAFDGPNVHQEALALGVRISGCTVHLVEPDGKIGEIIEQAAVNVEISDSQETLHKKVTKLLAGVLPKTLERFVRKKFYEHHTLYDPIDFSVPSSADTLSSVEAGIQSLVQSTTRPGFMGSGTFNLRGSCYFEPYLVSGTDGVGTKLKIAQACDRHDTIGIDLVAMCVNDILTHGAEPLLFMATLACASLSPDVALAAFAGIAEGCRQANCALVGTELNVSPDIYIDSHDCIQNCDNYDVVGYAEGALQKENLLPRLEDMGAGDIVIGMASSGVHSNGYSLVRKLVQVLNLRYQDPFPLDPSRTLGDVLLTPTKIYVRSLLPLMRKGVIKAAAHITGGGLTENIPRVLPAALRVSLDGATWQMPKVLQWIAQEGGLSDEEMLKTFNCGLGMVLIVDPKHEKKVLAALKARGETAATIGRVESSQKGAERVEVRNFNISRQTSERKKKRVGVLISGSGTNLQALIDYTQNPANRSSAEIVLVLSNIADVEGLKRAQRASIPTRVLSHKSFKTRVEFDTAVDGILREHGVEIVCLAGFMRIVSKEFVHLWQGKLLNIHPAILPSFKGVNAHKLAVEYGAKVTGCTVHFVEAEVDAGAIIAQAAAHVEPGEDEASLRERIKPLEHRLFPAALELLAAGRLSRDPQGKVRWH